MLTKKKSVKRKAVKAKPAKRKRLSAPKKRVAVGPFAGLPAAPKKRVITIADLHARVEHNEMALNGLADHVHEVLVHVNKVAAEVAKHASQISVLADVAKRLSGLLSEERNHRMHAMAEVRNGG